MAQPGPRTGLDSYHLLEQIGEGSFGKVKELLHMKSSHGCAPLLSACVTYVAAASPNFVYSECSCL